MKKIGIYKLTAPNNKVYIGQSIDIEKRWKDYYKLKKNSIGRKLYNSFLKYGVNSFLFEIIHECDNSVSKEFLNNLEKHYCDMYSAGILLNLKEGGGSNGKHSEETKKKMSISASNVKKSESHKKSLSLAKIKNPTKFWENKKFSDIHKEKLSVAKQGKISPLKGIPCLATKERFKKYFEIDTGDNVELLYCSLKDLSLKYKVSTKAIKRLLKGNVSKKLTNIKTIKYGNQEIC